MSLSENLLSVLFSIQGYSIKSISECETRVVLHLTREEGSICPHCGSICSRYDSRIRELFIGSVNGIAVYCAVRIYRVACSVHGVVTEDHGISDGQKRYSKAAGASVVQYTRYLDNVSTGKLLGLSSSTVYRIDREALGDLVDAYRTGFAFGSVLSVDEVAYKRHHHYATVLSDFDQGKVLWLEKDRTCDSLKRAYSHLSNASETVQTVTMDFWRPFEKATRETLPDASIVYDKFHLARLLNRAVENQRRAYQRDLPEEERKIMKKQSRWILLKREKNLSEQNRSHLEELKRKNEPLFIVYMLKESFLSIFEEDRLVDQAKVMIDQWIEQVMNSSFQQLKTFARSLMKRFRQVLEWFEKPVSNGKAEGINNVIKTLLKRAYGYKDFDYFRMKVLQRCGNIMEMATHEG